VIESFPEIFVVGQDHIINPTIHLQPEVVRQNVKIEVSRSSTGSKKQGTSIAKIIKEGSEQTLCIPSTERGQSQEGKKHRNMHRSSQLNYPQQQHQDVCFFPAYASYDHSTQYAQQLYAYAYDPRYGYY
jgi:hypothetical protein